MSTNFKPHPALLCDYYKLSHREQYPEGTEYIYSTWIPRKSIMPNVDGVVAFGFQAFVERYLVSYFKENFFDQDINELAGYYEKFVESTLGTKTNADHLRYLHNLGYLPLRVMAVPEGTLVPLRVPMLTIENTDPQCFWLTNFIETLFSNESWMASTSATIAYEYRKLLNLFADMTVGNRDFVPFQGHDFSMRGMSGIDASAMSGAGHLLSFAGTDTIPAIEFLMQYYGADIGHELVGTSIPACYDDQTEILTEKGFVNFKNLETNIKVAQYHENGLIDFVIPSEYFEDDYDGNMIHFESKNSEHVDIMVTPNHKMVRLADKTKELSLFEAGSTEYKYRKGYSHRYHLPVAGKAEGNNRLSFIERLKIAFQADGSFPSHAQKYTGERSGTYPIRFSLKKDRKVKRLKWILDQSGTKYTYTKYDNGYSSFWVNSPEKMEKGFNWVNLSNISSLWASDFIEEVSHWDGNKTGKNGISYYNSNKLAVEKAQSIATVAGYKTYLSECEDLRDDRQIQYSVNCLINRSAVSGQTISKTSRPYFGKVYCVSVPSKMIVVRRNGQVAVCGNTEHSVMCAYGRDELACYKRIITEIYPEGLVSIVSDTWDLWEVLTNVIAPLKNEILNRDGRIVIRPDSGDPVNIICGDSSSDNKWAQRGVIDILWEIFGGTVTPMGYKQLDTHIGCIYGDAITLTRCREICERLERMGYASTNMVYGIGSYSYQYTTRDTFGFALKSTWARINGTEHNIFKDPITDSGMKKSLTGRVVVTQDPKTNIISALDGLSKYQEESFDNNLLRPIFVDGIPQNQDKLSTIRGRLMQ